MRHPLFARAYDRLIAPAMERELSSLRRELLAGLHGRVLEVGAGNGLSFVHYPPSVTEVVALEPEPYLRAQAELAANVAPVAVTVREGLAETLPFAAASFDAAVASIVLCSVADPARALSELRRVLRPGGKLCFFEHVRSDRVPKATVQALLDRSGVWPLLAGGCHCARETVNAIAVAGFRVDASRRVALGPAWLHTNPWMLGTARA
ncbi:MAG TPA: class I SAM-dependent methyltransferase [Solirubrobacteraceae bacterium]|nr:class I SAM-dependent methyltransferase [Solirubrobacteraceae bacterium]